MTRRVRIIQAARKERECHAATVQGERGFDGGPLPERHTGEIHKGESYGLYHAYGEQRAACVWCLAAAFGRDQAGAA